ncbi:MAG: flagellar basal body L-ring protein FlgH, partial [Deltaproteobacteria bacterium]|nr:flagellar basal body L-ring protein FlgH [Deltaproteobacteria bacterium]
ASTSTSELQSTGETKRENYVTATIGARVLQVLPGGLLQLEGAREVRVNEETQYMVVSGIVRAKDVASDNSVESTQLADSRIEYYGKGVLADKQKSGWLTRLLDNVWPF